jgi:hypothetical protein
LDGRLLLGNDVGRRIGSRGDSWIAVSDVGRVSGVTRMVSLDTLEGVLTLLEKIGDVRFALLTEDEGPADIGGC